MKRNIDEAGSYLIHVLGSVLKGQKAEEKPEGITFEQLFGLAKFHSVAGMACYGVERLAVKPEGKLCEAWKKYRDLQVVKSFAQMSEKKRILDYLTGKGIDVLPLKGCLLMGMYPQSDYREMADLDILIDAPKAETARAAMEELGYRTVHFNDSHHDNYEKHPYMGVELHRYMVPETYEKHDYYRDVWAKAIADETRPGVYHFSWDDYYIFMLVHSAKHYFSSGSGIRTIMDIHVFLQKYGKELHSDYLKEELKKLNLLQFAQDAKELSEVWFEDGQENERTAWMARQVLTSGTYGTREKKVENGVLEIEKQVKSACLSRAIYFMKRCFLNRNGMYFDYPVLKRAPALLPFCWVHRWIFAIVRKRDRIAIELRALIK